MKKPHHEQWNARIWGRAKEQILISDALSSWSGSTVMWYSEYFFHSVFTFEQQDKQMAWECYQYKTIGSDKSFQRQRHDDVGRRVEDQSKENLTFTFTILRCVNLPQLHWLLRYPSWWWFVCLCWNWCASADSMSPKIMRKESAVVAKLRRRILDCNSCSSSIVFWISPPEAASSRRKKGKPTRKCFSVLRKNLSSPVRQRCSLGLLYRRKNGDFQFFYYFRIPCLTMHHPKESNQSFTGNFCRILWERIIKIPDAGSKDGYRSSATIDIINILEVRARLCHYRRSPKSPRCACGEEGIGAPVGSTSLSPCFEMAVQAFLKSYSC